MSTEQQTRNLLDTIEESVNKAAQKAIIDTMQYSPLMRDLANDAVKRRTSDLTAIFDRALITLAKDEVFKAEVEQALREKLAKLLVASQTGEVERIFNQIKADPIRRANMTQMIARIATEI